MLIVNIQDLKSSRDLSLTIWTQRLLKGIGALLQSWVATSNAYAFRMSIQIKSDVKIKIQQNFNFWGKKTSEEKNLVGIWKQEMSLKRFSNKGAKNLWKENPSSSLQNQKLSKNKTCGYLVSKSWET